MRAPLAIALLVCLVAGCNTRQQVAGAGLGMTVAGVALTYSGDERDESSRANDAGIALLLVGLVTLFTAAALEETAARDAHRERYATPPRRVVAPAGPDPRLQVRERAWQTTKQAQQAARDGDCAKVSELSATVGALDAEFYAEVFMKDAAIQRCFTAAQGRGTAPPPAP